MPPAPNYWICTNADGSKGSYAFSAQCIPYDKAAFLALIEQWAVEKISQHISISRYGEGATKVLIGHS